MENERADTFVFPGQQPSIFLIQRDETWRGRVADLLMGIVHPITCVQVEDIAVEQNAGMGGIMGIKTDFFPQVNKPQDVRVRPVFIDAGTLPTAAEQALRSTFPRTQDAQPT